ncbi:MAG TPA: helix-turn-helix domain-containing protein [Acidimicrobiia bacterium]|nr:helix-turn-helix domain-containing protein [Acidimicrobiia bacterium]
MDKLLLNPKEAADMLSVSRAKLYELLAAGKLDSVRIDGCRRIPVQALYAYIERLSSNDTGGVDDFAA